jgi:hypothetical protein
MENASINEFAIKTGKGWVAGLNRQHMTVMCTNDIRYAKRFKTHKAANNFRRKHADDGMGLAGDAEVVSAPSFFS